MNFKKIYTFPVAIGAILFFLGNASGPGNVNNFQVSGAPGSGGDMGTCGNTGCHAAGAFDPSMTIELLNGADPVDKYIPGQSYTLKIVTTPGTGTPSRYGFQAVSLDASDEQAGAWGDVGPGKQTVTLGGREYAEQSSGSMSGTFEMEWIAPAMGTGNVTIYAAGNATNGNGSPAGDGSASSTLDLEEGTPSSTLNLQRDYATMEVMPNPVGDQLTVQVTSRTSGNFNMRVVDVTGAVVQTEKVNLTTGINREEFDVASLPAGLYILQLCGDQHVAATQMMKK